MITPAEFRMPDGVDCEQLLFTAASIIDVHGWKQGMMFDNGACCALGAIWLALVEQRADLPKPTDRNATLPVGHLHFLKASDLTALTDGRHISSWNDVICKSQSEMVAKLRELAKVLA